MNINIKGTNMELTDAITDYVNKRLDSMDKFLKDKDAIVHVEIGKVTNHHKHGDIFKAEFDIKTNGEHYFTVSEKEDLYAAVDDVKEEVVRQIKRNQNRKRDLFKRGALSVKKMLKGISKRNPFTSKY